MFFCLFDKKIIVYLYFFLTKNFREWDFLLMHHMTRAGFNETEEKEFTVMPVNLELLSETMEVIPVVNKARQFLNWDELMNTNFFYPRR